MNKKRISNWLSSRYGDGYGEYYYLPYPITDLGFERLLERILDQYPQDWNSQKEKNYIDLLISQMGMDARTGESICPSDLSRSKISFHHYLYWKGTSDPDLLVLLSSSSHSQVVHPLNARGSLPLKSVIEMMTLSRAKSNFKNLKPAEH